MYQETGGYPDNDNDSYAGGESPQAVGPGQ
jgi:hypothetical protein